MSWQEKIQNSKFKFALAESMAGHSSMSVGGSARFYFEAKKVEDIIELIRLCALSGAPYKVIGGGTNIIVSDQGFDGVIIRNGTSGISVDKNTGRVIAESGTPLSMVILEAASCGFGGLEPLYGIPGSVGGAIINNAGTHGVAVGDYMKSATIMFASDELKNLKASWFLFEYRRSKLKYKKDGFPPVILSAIFQFQRKKKDDIMSEMAKFKKWRIGKQPLGAKTSGSIFRNPSGTDNATDEEKKFKSAGYLLEQVGAKKMAVGGARVSKIHANWVENHGGATASDVRRLTEKMRSAVEEKFQITLDEEIEYIGKWDGA